MKDDEMFGRNVELEGQFTQYVLSHPELLDELPDEYQLVILPDDDPELAKRNQELLELQNFDKPIVVVRMNRTKPADVGVSPPQVSVLAAH